MSRYCYIYSEQELTPRAAETISKIKSENGWDDVKFVPYQGHIGVKKVLVFGRKLPENAMGDVEYIHTYSVAQIMSKANAITVLDAALGMYFGSVHQPTINGDLDWYVRKDSSPYWFGFDYDLPVAIDIETDGNLGKTHTP